MGRYIKIKGSFTLKAKIFIEICMQVSENAAVKVKSVMKSIPCYDG